MSNIPYQLAIGPARQTVSNISRVNLVKNPSFEVDTTGWVAVTPAGAMTRVIGGLFGAYRIAVGAVVPGGFFYIQSTDDVNGRIPVTAGNTYTASYYYTPNTIDGTVQVEIYWYDSSNNFISNSIGTALVVLFGTWGRPYVTGVAPAGASYARLVLVYYIGGNDRLGFIDAVLMEEGSALLPYFDGSTTDTLTEIYSWTGTPNLSISQQAVISNVPTTAPTQSLSDFDSWNLSRNLDDGCTISLQMAGNSIPGVQIKELETDIWVYENGQAIDRFRVVAVDQEWEENGENRLSVQAVCYRRILASRHVITPLTYTGVSQGDIVWDLIQHTQGQTNGNLGITLGSSGPVILRDRAYLPGQNILEAIVDLAQADGNMTWDIDENLELFVSTASSFPLRAMPAQLGTNLRNISKPSGASLFGNVALVSGDTQFTTLQVNEATSLPTDTRGRWEKFRSFSQEQVQANLDEQARGILESTQSPSVVWSFEVIPDRFYTDSNYAIGDFVVLAQPSTIVPSQPDPTIPYQIIPSASILVQILTVTLTVDANGASSVKMTAVQAPQSWNTVPTRITWDSVAPTITWDDMLSTYLT